MTFCGNKAIRLIFTCCLAVLTLSVDNVNAQTYYYKLTKKKIGERVSTAVSGGQFVTFCSDICFESDKKGQGIGHGYLKKNLKSSNNQYAIYEGKSYWDNQSVFKFTKDLELLNVITDDGGIYLYTRTTAPPNQITCSLIREKESNSHSTNATPSQSTPAYGNSVYIAAPSSYQNSSSGSSSHSEIKTRTETCQHCWGSGKCETCNGKGWFYNPFNGNRVLCPNCQSNHNGCCSFCGGTGKITKTVEY